MTKKDQKYLEGIGRRKESIARVRITDDGNATFLVNDKKFKEYFPVKKRQDIVSSALGVTGLKKMSVSAKVRGGGITGQAEAIKLGLARALVKHDDELRKALKDLDYLNRDSRRKERKKPGLKKARRSAQWRKR